MSKVQAGPIQANRLKSFIERIERMEEEQAALAADKRDIYSEAKGAGYDVKTMRKVIALRKMNPADRDEQEALLDTYMHALGMVDRVEARAAAGQSAREIAAAENISKSTAHRVSQKAKAKNANAETGHPAQDGQPSAAIAEGEGAGVIAAPSGLPETKPTRANNAPPALPVAREEEADTSADDARHPSPPSDPASQEVNAGPSLGRESLSHLDGQGTHPGTYRTCAENAKVGDGLDIPSFLKREKAEVMA